MFSRDLKVVCRKGEGKLAVPALRRLRNNPGHLVDRDGFRRRGSLLKARRK